MVVLDDLDAEIREMAVRLPYRVGLWMSDSDGAGGTEADIKEQEALETLIMAYAEDFIKSEFVQALMEEAVRRKTDWLNWDAEIANTPEECRKVIAALQDKLEKRDLEAFKSNLIEIAYSVALAYREFDRRAPLIVKMKTYWLVWRERLNVFVNGEAMKSTDELLNISAKERECLLQLGEALGRKIREAA